MADDPQPVDQAIDNLVVVLLQERPDLDREQAYQSLQRAVQELFEG